MTIDLSYLLTKENISEEVVASFEQETITVAGDTFQRISSDPLVLTFFNESGSHIYVSGHSSVTYIHPCDRCLADVEITVPYSVSEEFSIAEEEILCDEEEGIRCVSENRLDVDLLAKNEILMNWPAKVLCKEDCKGICPVCGKNRNLVDCGCDTFVPDPRMMQIQDVFNEFMKQ